MFSVVERVRILVLGVLVLLTVVIWLPASPAAATTPQYLTVRFLDVGQGDAIHIMTPDGYEMLIDGGPSASVLRELAAGRSLFDHYIDVVVATHPDTDHIAGLVDVLERYEVGMLLETAAENDAPAAVAFAAAARTAPQEHFHFSSRSASEKLGRSARRETAQAGQVIQLGASTTVRVLSPAGNASHWETNTASVVIQVQYGDVEFMLTGDAPRGVEEYLAGAEGAGLESEVLKLGHHGSDTSSSELFLETVQPQYAVVSAGKDNRYGHPKPDVLTRASSAGARIVSTIDNGTIIFESDGKTVWLK